MTDDLSTRDGELDVGAYCREIEAHLCRRNSGHIIRLVGPAFVLAARWAGRGVPLRVVLHGIDRRVARSEARGGTRRPLRLEFCEADVEDAFVQWRRAVGHHTPTRAPRDEAMTGHAELEEVPSARRPPSLPRHIERVIERLSSVRATCRLAEGAGEVLDATIRRLDDCLSRARGARGDARRAIETELQGADEVLLDALVAALPASALEETRSSARAELRVLATRMSVEAYRDAETRLVRHLIRTQLGLPQIASHV